jgi:hypothetical protein
MLLIDDLLLAPLHGLLWIARKVDEAVSQEQEKEEEELQARLRELHLRLETGQLGEAEFEQQEAALLDRLDAIAKSKGDGALDEAPADSAEQERDHDEG